MAKTTKGTFGQMQKVHDKVMGKNSFMPGPKGMASIFDQPTKAKKTTKPAKKTVKKVKKAKK